MTEAAGSHTRAIALPRVRLLDLSSPVVMGILNVTPDSFSDGGDYVALSAAVGHALTMTAEGAALIDIGGESSRPGASPVTSDEEQRRVIPVIRAIRKQSDIPISIDTYHADTARAAIDAGADIINDITALRGDTAMAATIAKAGVPVVLMHMQGTPMTMQKSPTYTDCIEAVYTFLSDRIAIAVSAGIAQSQIIIDPGIGFGKRLEDNLRLLAQLDRFTSLGCPILVGASRKSFIGALANGAGIERRLGGSVAAALIASLSGARIVRAHDVAETVQALAVARAISEAGR